MIKLRRLFVAAVLTASLAFWFVQRRTITRLEVRISKLRAETTRIVDLEPVRAENRRLAEKKALAEELDRLRATTRELPQLRARLAQLEQKEKSLPNEAAAEDESSLTENEKLLERLKEKGLYSFAQEDLPTLIRILKDPELFREVDVRVDALGQLRRSDPAMYGQLIHEVVPAAVAALKHEDQWTRWRAAGLLGAFGADAKTAVPALIEALETRHGLDWGFQVSAAAALGMMGPEAKEAVPALIRTLQSGEPGLRSSAGFALSRIGPDAKSAVPSLLRALQDQNEEVRHNAKKALEQIDPTSVPAAP
jgi:HEAT repeat protein